MAEKYPIVFSKQSGLLQEIGPDDTLIVDNISSSNLQVTGIISVPGGGSLDTLRLASYGISGDPTLYSGTGSIVSNKLRVSGISTSRFALEQKVKLFGVTLSSDSTPIANVPAGCSFAKIGITSSGTTYRYWLAQYDYRSGKVGASAQIAPNDGVTMTTLGNFNDLDHIGLTIERTESTSGILVYRSENSATIGDAKLVAILGPKNSVVDSLKFLGKIMVHMKKPHGHQKLPKMNSMTIKYIFQI
jgi:hypothetical protein